MELPPRRVELPLGKGLELGLLGGLERVVWLASSVDGRGYSPEGGRKRAAEGLCYRETIRVGTDHKRSEEHTSELQSHHDLVCRLLLEKKKNQLNISPT